MRRVGGAWKSNCRGWTLRKIFCIFRIPFMIFQNNLEVTDWQFADAHVAKLHHLTFHFQDDDGDVDDDAVDCDDDGKDVVHHASIGLLLDNLVLLLQGLLLDVLLVAVLQPLHFQMMASPPTILEIYSLLP